MRHLSDEKEMNNTQSQNNLLHCPNFLGELGFYVYCSACVYLFMVMLFVSP